MPHLAAQPRLALAVEVEARAGLGGEFLPIPGPCAQEIGHHDVGLANSRAERPAGDRADMVLELADEPGILVQWPELCTRGANSLTRSRYPSPARTTKNSMPMTPT